MRLLASTDIALRVLMLFGHHKPGDRLRVEQISGQLGGLSRNHLHKIVQDLAGLGILQTVRGAGGGVALAKPLGQVRLGSLVRELEADQPLVECFRADGGCCALTPDCRLRTMLRAARKKFYDALDEHTLADCVPGRWFDPAERRSARRRREGRTQRPRTSEHHGHPDN